MELNWTTFLLEAINFLVLVWLLKRFLYRPVRAAIEKRRLAIEQDLTDAREQNRQAAELLARRQQQVAHWEEEKKHASVALQDTIAAERERRLAELERDMAAEQERLEALQQHRQQEQQRELERKAMHFAGAFTTRLLARFSGPELEALIVRATIDELRDYSDSRAEKLRQALASGAPINVVTTRPLPEASRQALREVLAGIAGVRAPELAFSEDTALRCGLQINIESLQIDANLNTELRFFSEAHRHV